MEPHPSDFSTPAARCGAACGGLSYCSVAKTLIAIPAIPLVAVIAASIPRDPDWQITLAAYSGAVVILAAQWIDRLAFLKKPIFPRKKQ